MTLRCHFERSPACRGSQSARERLAYSQWFISRAFRLAVISSGRRRRICAANSREIPLAEQRTFVAAKGLAQNSVMSKSQAPVFVIK